MGGRGSREASVHPCDTNLMWNKDALSQTLSPCSRAHAGTASPHLSSRSVLWACIDRYTLNSCRREGGDHSPFLRGLPPPPERTLSLSGCLVTPHLCLLPDTFVIRGSEAEGPKGPADEAMLPPPCSEVTAPSRPWEVSDELTWRGRTRPWRGEGGRAFQTEG